MTRGMVPLAVSDQAALGELEAENERVKHEILNRVQRDLFQGVRPEAFRSDDWQILDYSSCLAIEWRTPEGREGVYVKIPKADINRTQVLPRGDLDCRMAEHEHASLLYLAAHWPGADGDARFVEPLVFYPDLSAIVTRRVWARELLHRFRRADLRLSRRRADGWMVAALERIGAAVGRFHECSAEADNLKSSAVDVDRVVGKIRATAAAVTRAGVVTTIISARLDPLEGWEPGRLTAPLARGLKGLDIRNILVDEAGALVFLDPGKLKEEPRQANIARLLVTIRILYWGTPWFLVRVTPNGDFEAALLRGAAAHVDDPVLRLYIIKELWKHWRAAYVALTRKRWPRPATWALARAYIDQFYAAEIATETACLVR